MFILYHHCTRTTALWDDATFVDRVEYLVSAHENPKMTTFATTGQGPPPGFGCDCRPDTYPFEHS